MTAIEPVRKDIENKGRIKKYSAPLRLWHWLSALIITGSLLTVLMNSTLFSRKATTALINNQAQEANATIAPAQVKSIAHGISDSIWQIHIYFGYCLAALLLFRIGLEFFQLADQKLIRKIKAAYRQYYITKKNREIARHELLVKLLYALFYLLLLTMVVTGLCLVFEDDVPALKAIHAIREIHGFVMYLILAFIAVHLAGVFLAERKDGKGIVSDMINGGREEK